MASRIEDYEGVEKVLSEVKAVIKIKRDVEGLRPAQSYGRIASEEVVSPLDIPAFATSHMDGFAVHAEDLTGASEAAPVHLRLVHELGPGPKTGVKIGHGEAVRIATGAPLPEGADTVVPVEEAVEGKGEVSVSFPPERGRWVYGRGSDMHRGDVVVPRGRPIRAQDVGMLLSLGLTQIQVYARPRVAVLATGSELTNRPSRRGRVRNSHSPIFLRLAWAVGAEAVDAGIARDSPRQIARKLRGALGQGDMVITLGGTSVGRHDVAGMAISSLHPELFHHGIRIDRGRVAGFAVVRGKPLVMLPGPIQGAMTAFLLLGIPIIDQLSGRTGGFPSMSATMGAEWKARDRYSGFTKVVYVRLQEEKLDVAEPLAGDTESMSILTKADGFVIVPEEVTRIQEGERVEVRLLPGFSFA